MYKRQALSPEELMQIVDLMLADTKKALSEKDINLEIDENAKKYLLEKGTDTKYGARPVAYTHLLPLIAI